MSRITDQVQAAQIAVVKRRGFGMVLTKIEQRRRVPACCSTFSPEVTIGNEESSAIWLHRGPASLSC